MEISGRPDQEGRQNDGSRGTSEIINKALGDIRLFLGDENGVIASGETGSECINKVTRAVLLNAPPGPVLSSPLEHPSTYDGARLWAARTGRDCIDVPFDAAAGSIEPRHYAASVTPDTRLAMVVHTSQTTGLRSDLAEIAHAIRAVAPDCFIIADGVQHAAHSPPAVLDYGVDAYVFSPYKMFTRSGKGIAWLSPRLAALPHDKLKGAPESSWDLGGRDAGFYASMSAVIDYLCWLGGRFTQSASRRELLCAAGRAVSNHERNLLSLLIRGRSGLAGLTQLPGVSLIGEPAVDRREAVVSFTHKDISARDIENSLEERDVRTASLVRDVYSRHVLEYLGVDDCVRATICHYNTEAEIEKLLTELAATIADEA